MFELRGFTSATCKKDLALDSIKQDDTPELSNILFEFIIEDSMSHFLLNDEKYSAYPCEKEVLLQDGLTCSVVSVKQSFNYRLMQNLTVIQLMFPSLIDEDSRQQVSNQSQQ